MTPHVTAELPEEAIQVLRLRPDQPPQELRDAPVLRWFGEGRFFGLLKVHQVSPVQMTANEWEPDLRNS